MTDVQKLVQAINKNTSSECLLDHIGIEPSHPASAMSRCGWLWQKLQRPHCPTPQPKNNKSTTYGEPKLRSALLGFFLITGLLTGCGSDSNDKSADTLSFAQATITATVGDAPSALQTTSGGKGTGAITYTSDTPAVATVDASGVVTIVGVGETIITATRAESDNYLTATATYTLTVLGEPDLVEFSFVQTPRFGVENPITFENRGGDVTDCEVTSFGSPIDLPRGLTLSVSADSRTCQITGRPTQVVALSVYDIEATNASGTSIVALNLLVLKGVDTLTFAGVTSDAVEVTFGETATITQAATGNGDGDITYEVLDSTTMMPNIPATNMIATVDDETMGDVTIVGAGTVIIQATIAESDNYLAATATYTLTVGATDNGLTRILKYYAKASNTDAGDDFGIPVALSTDGSTLAIGAFAESSNAKNTDGTPDQTDNSAANAGAVYVFTRSGASWSQQAYLKASNTDAGDFFGSSVALSDDGNTLAVSAIIEHSNAKNTDTNPNQADNSAINAGAVYVFTRSGASWNQEIYLKASNTGAGDFFGISVALSGDGNTLVVGAAGEDSNAKNTDTNPNQADNSAENSGAVYVFTRTGTSWSQESYLKASNTGGEDQNDDSDLGDQFGIRVTLSGDGNTLAVGANGEDSNAKNTDTNPNQADNSAENSGAVYVFTRTGSSWSQQAYLKASNTDAGDFFGISVALGDDGNTLVVGARGEDSNAKNADATPDQTNNSAENSGAVYVFTRSGVSWSQQTYLKASNTGGDDPNDDSDLGDRFGVSVALSGGGSTLAVGASGEDSNTKSIDVAPNQADNSTKDAGAVYVFTRTGASWSQENYLKASNTDAGDEFGRSVALSDDGNTLAVGASEEASSAKNTDATPDQADDSAESAGAVYIY